jgi:hypothetical protein
MKKINRPSGFLCPEGLLYLKPFTMTKKVEVDKKVSLTNKIE